jgi:predicted nucleic acid-binding protein
LNASTILDTGPLVAFLNRRDRFHDWAVARLGEIEPPLLTCEAVLSEACFLLRHLPAGPAAVLELVERDLVRVGFSLGAHLPAVSRLLVRYARVPISLADACLIRLAELNTGSPLLTLDSDFRIYRLHGRRVIPALLPPAR